MFGSCEWTKQTLKSLNLKCGLLHFVFCYFIWEMSAPANEKAECLSGCCVFSTVSQRQGCFGHKRYMSVLCVYVRSRYIFFTVSCLLVFCECWLAKRQVYMLNKTTCVWLLGLFWTCKTSIVWTYIKALCVFVQSVILSLDPLLLSRNLLSIGIIY